jgi:hypothetical protein
MLAAAASRGDVGVLLVERFPECVSWTNKLGLDAVSYLSLNFFPSFLFEPRHLILCLYLEAFPQRPC